MALTKASEPTIRRDFQELENQGAVERFHGGVRVKEQEGNVTFDTRNADSKQEKQAIARMAANLLKKMTLFL